MSKKLYILSIVISLWSISASAQIEADISRPSANAEQFGIALKAESALSKGQLSLNIPLMELKGKGYDLPISLSFYNGDVTACTEASPIGLGWALMAGGVIATTIRGADDSSGFKNDHHNNCDYIQNMFYDEQKRHSFIDSIRLDPMPDEQTYSIPGHSGIVEVSFEGATIKRTLFPDESYIIEPATNGFCITTDDGNKFYFEDAEYRTIYGSNNDGTESTSWFLSRITTTKGGTFTFNYDTEEYIDLSSIRSDTEGAIYKTKRLSSIVSDFGTVRFYAESRSDRGNYGHYSIHESLKSKRINKIELRDENGTFVKGYELDNSGYFKLYERQFEDPDYAWYNYRQKLSSITQYDATGNRLPPYTFTYSCRLSKPMLTYMSSYTTPEGDYIPYESWTSSVGSQVYVDLSETGAPLCYIGYEPNATPEGITLKSEDYDHSTVDDCFCLDSICYPTGAIEVFSYESHRYSKINNTPVSFNYTDKVQGRRLAARVRYGSEIEQRTEYVYQLHDTNYNANGPSSGILTNPSIHGATYYTPATSPWGERMLRASRMTSGKPFNTIMGPPVCYTEVEEIKKDGHGSMLNRTIHYFEPQIVSPPINYVFLESKNSLSYLATVENRIFGRISGYTGNMSGMNNADHTYIAYPVGEFYNVSFVVDKPLKEVFIGKDGEVRSIKNYSYILDNDYMDRKYGYKLVSQEYPYYTVHLISKSEYITRHPRLYDTYTTRYYYDGNSCDSICESSYIRYSKGRVNFLSETRRCLSGFDWKSTMNYFPSDIENAEGNSSSPSIAAVSGLIEKNIVAAPIKTVVTQNGTFIGGECKDYQMLSGMPLLKSLYKLKAPGDNVDSTPIISGTDIDYKAELYKEGEVITYDEYMNPEHVKLNGTQNRVYVWGYGGRFPIAVIDNMDGATFRASTNLRSQILQLSTYKKIETEEYYTNLKSLNAAIRNALPASAHITTYTYDPYFGMTSETDDSNIATIYTYDSFGRLSARHDTNYKRTEEYNYHYYLQQ